MVSGHAVDMAAIWRGALVFGLVNVQVKLHRATEDHDSEFHQVHAADGGRIRYRRVCEVCGAEVEFRDIARAWHSPDGQDVIVTTADLESLPSEASHEIEVLEFVPAKAVDPILLDRSYYLEPERSAVRPYVLLRQALAESDRIAIAQIAIRSKTQLAVLRVVGNVIALQTMLWADEVRRPDFTVLEGESQVRTKELELAAQLIDSLAGDFDPEQFHDEYQAELSALLKRKLAPDPITPLPAGKPETTAAVVDLIAALQDSIKRREQQAGAHEDAALTAPGTERPPRRSMGE